MTSFSKTPRPGFATRQRSKYGNVRTLYDGIWFASDREAKRYAKLKLLLRAGEISDLRRQVSFKLVVQGTHVTTYRADFVYLNKKGETVVDDAKGYKTEEFKIKAKLMHALLGIEVLCT